MASPRGDLGLLLAPSGGSLSLRAAGSFHMGRGCSNKFLRPLHVWAPGGQTFLPTPGLRPGLSRSAHLQFAWTLSPRVTADTETCDTQRLVGDG